MTKGPRQTNAPSKAQSDGEATLRVLDIARTADVVLGLINHHFDGRDALVAAAQLERFAGDAAKDQDRIRRLLDEDPSREDVRDGLRQISGDIVSRRRAAQRLIRVTIICSAHGRPELAEELGGPASQHISGMAEMIELAQQAGHVRTDLMRARSRRSCRPTCSASSSPTSIRTPRRRRRSSR
jgi:AcrR family transcriptional regulator